MCFVCVPCARPVHAVYSLTTLLPEAEFDEEDALVRMPSPAGNGGEQLDEEERLYESEQARAKRAEEAAAAARKQRDQRAEARLHNDAQNNSCSALFIIHYAQIAW